jgi:hypothetical protein
MVMLEHIAASSLRLAQEAVRDQLMRMTVAAPAEHGLAAIATSGGAWDGASQLVEVNNYFNSSQKGMP